MKIHNDYKTTILQSENVVKISVDFVFLDSLCIKVCISEVHKSMSPNKIILLLIIIRRRMIHIHKTLQDVQCGHSC